VGITTSVIKIQAQKLTKEKYINREISGFSNNTYKSTLSLERLNALTELESVLYGRLFVSWVTSNFPLAEESSADPSAAFLK